ncbi:MAG: PQQ-binding-like beta-propeller repeat protein [Planctomycetaceae bacterium]|nr:PQQ-binding-like beta-propeller repeat protein [Planctomycetaceae bacterium]
MRVFTFCLTFITSLPVFGADWTGFRGPGGLGISSEADFPKEWSPEKNIQWRTPLPGPGNGSPIVVDGKVLVLCAEDQGQKRSTLCFDRQTGKELWKQTVSFPEVEETHKTNPFCPSTPTSDGDVVVVWHRSAGMHCYDLDGDTLWSRDLGRFDHIWGGGSSPILFENMVIQLCGPGERTFVVALDKKTGETLWQTPTEPGGSDSSNGRYIGTWSTPVLVTVDGQPQLLVPFHTRLAALDPKSGKELWTVSGLSFKKGDLIYTSPMVENGIAVIMGGFNGPAFGLTIGGEGDVTDSHRLWHSGEQANPQRIGSGVVLGGYLYMANADNPGSLECLDIKTGEQTWSVRRTDDGPHWGSVVAAGDTLYVTGQRGTTRVFRANPKEYELIAENDLKEQSNSTPALSDGDIFLRTWDALYCISGG